MLHIQPSKSLDYMHSDTYTFIRDISIAPLQV